MIVFFLSSCKILGFPEYLENLQRDIFLKAEVMNIELNERSQHILERSFSIVQVMVLVQRCCKLRPVKKAVLLPPSCYINPKHFVH